MKWTALYRRLASMAFGLGLFAAIALSSALGSLIPNWGTAIYGSWWFAGLLVALVLNTGLCAGRQIKGLRRGSWRFRLVWLVHLSVLLVAVTCLWATRSFQSTSVAVGEGQEFSVGAERWVLEQVTVNHYSDGRVSDWISRVRTPRGETEIRVNQPGEADATMVLQSGYHQTYSVTVEQNQTAHNLQVDQDVEVPFAKNAEIGFAITPLQDGLIQRSQRPETQPQVVNLLITSHGRILQRTALFVGYPLELGDTGLRLTVLQAQAKSTFLIRQAPGISWLWLSFALLAISVTGVVLLPKAQPKEPPHA